MARLPIRNIGIFGKDGSGKTTLSEAILYLSKAKKDMGSVAAGTTTADFESEEHKRKFTLRSSVCHTTWKKEKLNIIDTPGYPAFQFDTKNTMHVMDAAIFALGADGDITSQARYLWKYANGLSLPTMAVVTHLDKEDADFAGALESLERRLGKKPLPLQIPYGEKGNFKGYIDLVENKLYEYSMDKSGKCEIKDIPADYEDQVEEYRMQMLEEVSMADEELMEKFLEEMDLTPEETAKALTLGFTSAEILPVVIATGEYLLGVDRMLDILYGILPLETLAKDSIAKSEAGEDVVIKSDDEEPFSAWVFKTFVDPFLGTVNIFKVISGKIKSNSEVFNSSKDNSEKVGQLYYVRGKELIQTDNAEAGDLVALTKLKYTETGDTLTSSKKALFQFPKLEVPNPIIQYAISLANKKDEDKLSGVIQRIVTADPTIKLIHDGELRQILLAGQGQIQLQATLEEIKRKYKIDIKTDKPKVPYRETIKGRSEAQGKYKKQTGGKGQYGDCHIRVKPLKSGDGFNFVDKIVGGVIPRNFIPSVEKGIIEAAKKGVLKGYPTIDFEVELFFGSYHDVDSSDMAFQIAGSMAYKKAMPEAKPIVLEPYVNLSIYVEDDKVGDVAGDISSRRGRVNGFDAGDGEQIVQVTVPLIEVMEYEPVLNQITSGNARFTMEFSHYEEFRGELTEIPENED